MTDPTTQTLITLQAGPTKALPVTLKIFRAQADEDGNRAGMELHLTLENVEALIERLQRARLQWGTHA